MSESRSLSAFLEWNGRNVIQYDRSGKPLEGISEKAAPGFILRFHNGLLDGGIYNKEGEVVDERPAVQGIMGEYNGHIEYWSKGRLHRDDGLPAVTANGFTVNEWWIDGKRQPSPKHE